VSAYTAERWSEPNESRRQSLLSVACERPVAKRHPKFLYSPWALPNYRGALTLRPLLAQSVDGRSYDSSAGSSQGNREPNTGCPRTRTLALTWIVPRQERNPRHGLHGGAQVTNERTSITVPRPLAPPPTSSAAPLQSHRHPRLDQESKTPEVHVNLPSAAPQAHIRTSSLPAVAIIASRGLKRTQRTGPGCPSSLTSGWRRVG
jgi:hypothetical protein